MHKSDSELLDALGRRFNATLHLCIITGHRWAYAAGAAIPDSGTPPQRVPLDATRGLIVYRAEPLSPDEVAELRRQMPAGPGEDAAPPPPRPPHGGMDTATIEHWLREDDPERLATLWSAADTVRRETVGDGVHLRGLIEMSNHCVRRCAYCGLHVGNRELVRYRMTDDEVMDCARQAVAFGYGTVVIQTGEDYGLETARISRLVRAIKRETPLAVTLSLGERGDDELAAWREAGADRYLLRFETSDPDLYAWIHPGLAGRPSDRFTILKTLRCLGYEVGSGVMIGIPGQSYASLATDIDRFRSLDLDMIGAGPFILHPDSDIARQSRHAGADQVPAVEAMVYKVIALARLVCPQANIPSTTALATLNKATGRETGLSRGANVVMPNLTPVQYRALYEIYPAKVCINETAGECRGCLSGRILSIGRTVARGPGSREHSNHPSTPT